jgi:predicted NBD/HSP70 family sugar kinase
VRPPIPDIAVLEILAGRDGASRALLAELTGLSAATVGRSVDRLARMGILRERPLGPAGVGRPPRLVSLEPQAACVVSVDAGGRTLRAALADMSGSIRVRAARPVRDPVDRDALIDDLVDIVREVAADVSAGTVQAVTAGISGIVDPDGGRVLLAPDLPGLAGTSLGEALSRRLDRPVAIDNDDLLAAIGEATTGAAQGCRDVVFLSLGFGLGAGLIVGGQPVRGASHAAGAIAYLAPGRLEAIASGRGIAARYREAARRLPPDTGHIAGDARDVFSLAARGDLVAAEVVDDALAALGDLVVAVAALLDPEVIVLGGGLTDAGQALFGPLGHRLATGVPYPPRLAASVLGDGAVLQGAVSVALVLARRRLAGIEPFVRQPVERGVLSLI